MRGRIATIAGIGVALGAAAPASASEVLVVVPGKGVSYVQFTGGSGERNRLAAETTGVDTVLVKDRGNDLEAGFGCTSLSASRASCDITPPPRRLQIVIPIDAQLGGKRDSAQAGPGVNWRLLDGGGGRDRLFGSDFSDFLDGGPGPDKIAGRGSEDTVFYGDRADDLRITLGDGKRNDGGRRDGRKRDLLKGIENVGGGEGDALIVGTSGGNSFAGRGGKDRLRGRGGDDHLFGFERGDTLKGGGGDDDLQGMEGNDRMFGAGGDDSFAASPDDGADLIDGGGDAGDSIMYISESRIQMDGVANDGKCADPTCASSSEGDNLKGLRELGAFFGNDLIIGADVAERIGPGPGADRVQARGGDDTIVLGPDSGAVDNVDCGTGTDTVTGGQPEDVLTNCE